MPLRFQSLTPQAKIMKVTPAGLSRIRVAMSNDHVTQNLSMIYSDFDKAALESTIALAAAIIPISTHRCRVSSKEPSSP